MKIRLPLLASASFAALALSGPADAALMIYQGSDAVASASAPRLNGGAAEAAFLAATGATTLVTFESSPLGSFSSLSPVSGLTITGDNISLADQTVRNVSSCPFSLCGGNTTAGGSKFIELYGGNLTSTFSNSIGAFGVYVGGVQLPSVTLTFNNGQNQTISLNGSGGRLNFVGFTDTSNSITSVRLNATNDIITFDDMRFGSVAAVPEPATWAMMIAGFGLVGGAMRYRRRRGAVGFA